MRKQNLGDLNGYLFEQLERLNDPDLTEQELRLEVERSRAISNVAEKVVETGKLVLKAKDSFRGNYRKDMPKLLDGNTDDIIDGDA